MTAFSPAAAFVVVVDNVAAAVDAAGVGGNDYDVFIAVIVDLLDVGGGCDGSRTTLCYLFISNSP